MMDAWVLSDESDFQDWEQERGGCVCGNYATRGAAIAALELEIVGPEETAQIVWERFGPQRWHGQFPAHMHRRDFYVLRQYKIVTEEALRATYKEIATL